MKDEEFLKNIIKKTENRFILYKKMLEDLFKDKVNFPINHEFVIWYKDFLREMKNKEEQWLKKNIEEIEYIRCGMNPPFYYKKKEK